MNKRYTMLVLTGLVLNTLAFGLPALTAEQEKARLATLWNLKSNNALTIAQFVENGSPTGDIIDRDIALLEKDIAQALAQKSWQEAFMLNKMVPDIFKGVAIGSGSVAALGALFSGVGTVLAYKVWSKNNETPVSYTDFLMCVYKEGLLGMSPGINSTEGHARWSELLDYSPHKEYNFVALFSGIISPAVAVVSLISAAISKYKKNADAQERANTNRVIIATLKQLKYDNGL